MMTVPAEALALPTCRLQVPLTGSRWNARWLHCRRDTASFLSFTMWRGLSIMRLQPCSIVPWETASLSSTKLASNCAMRCVSLFGRGDANDRGSEVHDLRGVSEPAG